MATNKPTPGGSSGTWGTELNGFLDVAHEDDGYISKDVTEYDLNGTSTIIKTKFITGTTDADSSTSITVTGATTIYTAQPLVYASNNESYRGQDSELYEVVVSGNVVTLSGVGNVCQGQAYRLRVDYV